MFDYYIIFDNEVVRFVILSSLLSLHGCVKLLCKFSIKCECLTFATGF